MTTITINEIQNCYLNWVKTLAFPELEKRQQYSYLLDFLYNVPFTYLIPLDQNRYIDGIDLRYRFGYEYNISDDEIKYYIDNRNCTVLEMMVALALKCEEEIMADPEIGNRIGNWFYAMLENSHLNCMTNDVFDVYYVDERIKQLLNRQYSFDGDGGLFKVRNPKRDMRTSEIWYQMCWYLDEII